MQTIQNHNKTKQQIIIIHKTFDKFLGIFFYYLHCRRKLNCGIFMPAQQPQFKLLHVHGRPNAGRLGGFAAALNVPTIGGKILLFV